MPEANTPHDAPEITVTVLAPHTTEPKQFTWPKTKRVGEAAVEAATAFGISGGNPTFMNAGGELLDRNRPLVAVGVRDGDTLELVDIGGGV